MKLISCKINSFGALKNFEYDFSEGLNTVKQDNGWGKSTFASFIKAMFYGLTDGKKSVADNERVKFRPWNSTERFGGSVVFEWAGERYKIERFFGGKASEDSVRLFDDRTGKEFFKTDNLGARIFGVDEEGFLSTAYFSQKDFEIKGNTSLTAKYNEMCGGKDEVKFDKAVARLEARAKEFKARGDKGLIADTKREIFAVNERIAKAKTAGETAAKLKEDAAVLRAETQTLKEKDAALRARAAQAGRAEAAALKRAAYKRAEEERARLTEELARAEEVLKGNAADDNTISSLKACIEDLERTREKRAMAQEDLEKLINSRTAAPETKPAGKTPVIISAVIFLILACAGAVLSFISIVPGIVCIGLAAVMLIVTIVLFVKSRKSAPSATVAYYAPLIEEKQAKIHECEEIERQYETTLRAFLSKYGAGEDYAAALEKISLAKDTRARAQKRIKELSAEIEELSKDKEIFAAREEAGDADKIGKDLAAVAEWYRAKAEALARALSAQREYEREAEELVDLENRKRELTEKAAEYAAEYDITENTLEFLKKADENLKTRYRAPLTESLNKYLKNIEGGTLRANIDIDLKITVEGGGAERDTDYFSKGYRNLFDICKRFALADVIFTKERPFLILDDPFCNLDDNKLSAALELIRRLQGEYQILYLVCHESRRA